MQNEITATNKDEYKLIVVDANVDHVLKFKLTYAVWSRKLGRKVGDILWYWQNSKQHGSPSIVDDKKSYQRLIAYAQTARVVVVAFGDPATDFKSPSP